MTERLRKEREDEEGIERMELKSREARAVREEVKHDNGRAALTKTTMAEIECKFEGHLAVEIKIKG